MFGGRRCNQINPSWKYSLLTIGESLSKADEEDVWSELSTTPITIGSQDMRA